MKKTIITILVSFFLTLPLTSVRAVDLSGLSVGVSAGQFAAYGYGKITEASITTEEAGAFTHEYGAIFVEYNFGAVSIGASYVPYAIETPQNTNVQGQSAGTANVNTNHAQAEFEDLTTIYALAPIYGPLYAKVGYSMTDVITKETIASGDKFNNTDTDGVTAGLGLQTEVDELGGITLRLEVLAAAYDDVSAVSTNGTKNVSVGDLQSVQATLSIMKSF